MAILKNCTVFWAKLDPKNPDVFTDPKTQVKGRPRWSVQIRTHNQEQMLEWEAAKLNVKRFNIKEGANKGDAAIDENGNKTWYSTLSKNATKGDPKKGETVTQAKPVAVIDGHIQPLDPMLIGNGSVANVSFSQLDSAPDPKTGAISTNTYLMSMQVTKLIKYVPQEGNTDVFEEVEMEVVEPENAHTEAVDTTSKTTGNSPKFGDDAF